MKKILISNATIWNGLGGEPFVGDLLVAGNRIESVGPTAGQAPADADVRIDGTGKFLMPGMTEGHAHLSFDAVTATEDLI
ncbi:MAG: amidohydrolase family protein, partial [Bacteroidales bacterium]|nr:amidohydrolase family protein [Bacteroidales bacterium]